MLQQSLPEKMKGKPAWLAKLINGIRDYTISGRIVHVDVRERTGTVEELRGTLEPHPSGTIMKLIVGGGGLPTAPDSDGTYVLAVDVTDGIASDPYWIETTNCSDVA